ncbi:hypothetical protein DPMN_004038 [Dreissena polymorpha]|uniref:Uncharacterized protein n=1 Tax=Dreissena polymorpha TaxID=45954 RepID=A0A9D4RVA0_DREPO|nr:hypothetical protein DPMN_004038 [Dreissena polymorpha]
MKKEKMDCIGMNLLTTFHEDGTINVASRVLTKKNAPPLGSDVFQANITIFELNQDIIETNLLIKFHEDWTINMASKSVNKANFEAAQRTMEDGQKAITKAHPEHIVLRLAKNSCSAFPRNLFRRPGVFGRTHRQTNRRTDSTTAICHPNRSIKMYQGV